MLLGEQLQLIIGKLLTKLVLELLERISNTVSVKCTLNHESVGTSTLVLKLPCSLKIVCKSCLKLVNIN